jgi:malonate transporter
MAALPPAVNLFVISNQNNVGVERASACVNLGTLLSTVTLAAFLYLVGTGRMSADPFP